MGLESLFHARFSGRRPMSRTLSLEYIVTRNACLFLLVVALIPQCALANCDPSKYQGLSREQAIGRAEVIVVAMVEESERGITANVEEILKGAPEKTLRLPPNPSTECPACYFHSGRFLLFLRKDGGEYHGINFMRCALPIRDGGIRWNEEQFSLKDFCTDIRRRVHNDDENAAR